MTSESIVDRTEPGNATDASFVPLPIEEQQRVNEHLELVLASCAFRNSKRYAAVLRFLVERSLDGRDPQLKERTIGIEVFGRKPDYDTSSDHVVRSAIAEIRKRLAQYYQEEGAQDAIRIDLQRGSYLPLFRRVEEAGEAESGCPAEGPCDLPEAAGELDGAPLVSSPWIERYRWWAASAALILVAAVVMSWTMRGSEDPLDRFWGPLIDSKEPMLLCIGTLGGGHQNPAEPPTTNVLRSLKDFNVDDFEAVHLNDARVLARIAGVMDAHGKAYKIASQSEVTYSEMQKGPSVLIGLMNNNWSERMNQDQRFTVISPAPWVLRIDDRENPGRRDWSLDYSVPYMSITKDYALIIRTFSPKTGQMAVTVGGLSIFGTVAAGEFLSNRKELEQLDAIAPRGWRHRNLEVVLSVDVIHGVSGHPVILASKFW